jgi:hypothetical protein
MSIVDAPLALVDRLMRRQRAIPPDEPIVRMLERLAHDIEPDPSYRRHLRGQALNRFVAAREGIAPPQVARARHMTSIGRGVLVASVLLATGAASVGAASQTALPGDGLYPLKLRIEELRIQVAPGDLKDELVVASLDARLAEIAELADRGQWQAAQEVAGRAAAIANDLIEMGPATSPATELALTHDVSQLAGLVAEAPASAVEALQHALEASSSAASVIRANGWRAPDGPTPPGQSSGGSSSGSGPAAPQGNGPGTNNGQGPGSNNGHGEGSIHGQGPGTNNGQGPGSNNPHPSGNGNPSGTGKPGGSEASLTPTPSASPTSTPSTKTKPAKPRTAAVSDPAAMPLGPAPTPRAH